jgi:hypothetical protein
MLETRLDMQRAKLESMARARTRQGDEQSDAAPAVPDMTGQSLIDMVDSLPSSESAEPLIA